MPDHKRPFISEEQREEFKRAFEGGPFMNPIPMEAENLKSLKDIDRDKQIEELTERIDMLEKLIRHIFGGHVLINGQFVKIP